MTRGKRIATIAGIGVAVVAVAIVLYLKPGVRTPRVISWKEFESEFGSIGTQYFLFHLSRAFSVVRRTPLV